MNGAVTVEWLLDHPDWYEMIDICSLAHGQAEKTLAERNKPSA